MRHLLAGAALLALAAAAPAAAQEIAPGGDIVVTYKDDVTTLDPAIGYDWQNWPIIRSIFDGLMDYEHGTTNLIPGLAERYEISPDGTTFTFYLRKGVKFHNGREMTADDVKYSLDRVTNPETQSPGAGFFGTIKGFDKMADKSATSLEGVTVVDPYTVKIELTRPDATFLHVMAINFASVVPKEAVDAAGGDFGRQPVGTGAYKFGEWTLGQRLVIQKNPDYWRPGVPNLDSVTFEIGQEPIVALLRLERGEVDILGDPIPPARFLEVRQKYPDQIIEGGQLHTGYVTMNTRMKPFDDVRVRRAVNMAIDKDRVVQVINRRGVPTNQPLPPRMPGYDPQYTGYPHDPAAAKALLAEAGYPDGFDTELFVANTDPQPRIAQAIQQDLAAIGIRASLQSLAQANVIAAGGAEDGAAMIWSGGMAWIADFPDPSNFYGPILGCAGAVPGGWNWAWYCNADLDKRAAEADAIVDPAKQAEREAAWRSIYIDIMKDAPWAPMFNEQRFTMRSARMGGPGAFYIDPISPVNYDAIGLAQ